MPRYIDGILRDIGVFAYLPNPTVTTTTLADTYYPITGPFTNTVIELFSLGIDSIIYDYIQPLYVQIGYSGTFESNINNTEVTVGIKHNGGLEVGSTGSFKLKLIGDSGTISGLLVLELVQNDTIQLVLKSDKAGAQITSENFSTSLSRMFQNA